MAGVTSIMDRLSGPHQKAAANSKPDPVECYKSKTPEYSEEYAFEWLENAAERGPHVLSAAWVEMEQRYSKEMFFADLKDRMAALSQEPIEGKAS